MNTTNVNQNRREDALRRAVLAMRHMRGRLETLEAEHGGAIAVIGIGCRYPGGVNDPESYWDLIVNGRDAVREVPADRWDRDAFYDPDPDAPGRMYTKHCGFIDQPCRYFDAGFFGLSPRETAAIDPQHRLLLEVGWEALENAGLSADRLMGSRSGVFVGISTGDYALTRYGAGGPQAIEPYWVLGTSASFAAGRLAYTFGFQGPAVSVDTVCSSSLVSAHMAMQALRRGECDMALAGGVNLIISPLLMIYFCKLRALSASGRCRTFDAGADGYVRGEGCGMLVLKRLADALAAGDSIQAVLRGSAVNHDGRSGGITVPNGPSQQAVIRRALEESGIDPAHVGYIEAHGTGTPLGDPIEMQALAATYGRAERSDGPLIIGSVKTQIGHLEAAAGVAGLTRAILALRHRQMPAHLHFETLNPHIESQLAGRFHYRLSRAGEEWPDPGRPRVAAVSSFGLNGTNAHLLLEEAAENSVSKPQERGADLLVLSAKTDTALTQLAQRYGQAMTDNPDLPLADFCRTAAVGRAHFRRRVAFCGASSGEIGEQIRRWLKKGVTIRPQEGEPRLALLFPDTARELDRVSSSLTARFPVFAGALKEHEAAPRRYALQVALLRLWQSYGLRPQLVMGQGAGRAAAATAVGVLSAEEGPRLARALEVGEPVPATLRWHRPKIEWRDAATATVIEDAKEVDWTDTGVEVARMPDDVLILEMEAESDLSGDAFIARTLQRLYTAGITPDWAGAEPAERFRRLVLPTYPFQRQDYWSVDTLLAPGTEVNVDVPVRPVVLRPVWRSAPLAEESRGPERVQLLTADTALAEVVVDCLRGEGIETEVLIYAGCTPAGHALAVAADTDEAAPLAELLQGALVDIRFLEPGALYSVSDLLPLLQALPEQGVSYWLATRGAFSLQPTDTADPAQAALWGMALSLRAERPDFATGLVDLDSADPAPFLREVVAGEIAAQPVAWRGTERFIRQTEPVTGRHRPPSLRDGASYLVTGGFGGIGQQLIRWLVARGARHIVVPSRRGRDDPRAAPLGDLDIQLKVVSCDLTDRQAVAKMIREIEHPLAGIFHAAGVVEDALIANQTTESLTRVMAAKVDVALALDEETQGLPLDHFVLFSSVAGVWGAAGQANYGAANAALQALAHRRRAQGRPALCIDWGVWDGPGMAAALSEQDRARLARQGIRPMPPEAALEALGMAMAGTETERIIGLFDAPQAVAADDTPTWSTRIAAAQGKAHDTLVAQCLCECVGQVLDLPANQIGEGDNLFDLGFDSLMVMDLVKLLKKALGCALYPRELYQTPVVGQLAGYLVSALSGGAPVAARPEMAPTAVTLGTGTTTETTPLGEPVPDIGFILSAPRSGSTLLRVMLAGHPNLFVPPELHLLPFATMQQRAETLADSYLDEGLVRALMELRNCDAEQAKREVADLIVEETPIQEIYRLLCSAAGGRRVIDKSPSYAAYVETLHRAERLCSMPRYIHLVRHPYAVIGSFVRQRMDRLIGADGADPFELAETIWRDMTRNILELARTVGQERCLLLRYEDLVREPERQARRLSDFLDVAYQPALLDPYSGPRMTDGIGDRSLSVGDPDFTTHKAIDPTLAEAWREVELPRDLSAETADLAREFDYKLPPQRRFRPIGQGVRMREESVSRLGIDLTFCRWGDKRAPAVVCLHGILEQGSIFAPLAKELVGAGYQVVAPDLRGHGKSGHCAASCSYQIGDFVADLDVVIRGPEMGPVILLGLSLGAAIATLFAIARPELVRDLILVEPSLQRRTGPEEAAKILRAQFSVKPAETADPGLSDLGAAIHRLISVYPKMTRAQATALAERGTTKDRGGLRWRWDPRLRAPAGVGAAAGQGDLIGQLQVPHRLIFSRQGDLLTAHDWQGSCNDNLRGIVTLTGGHALHVEAPEALAELVIRDDRSESTIATA